MDASMRRAWVFERDQWRSLWNWVLRRRPGVAEGDVAFGYHALMAPLMWVLTGVSVIEVVAVELLLPWPLPRAALLVAGVWSLRVVVAMVAGYVVHPHLVGRAGMRVRYGTVVDVVLPWTAVSGVRSVLRACDGAAVQVVDGVLHLVVSGQTNVEVALVEPVWVTVPGRGPVEVSAVRLHVDTPGAFVAAAHRALTPT
ncbi:hypothetical protein WEH80_01765 [Actinomycetes bacterium KLBMP 9759]